MSNTIDTYDATNSRDCYKLPIGGRILISSPAESIKQGEEAVKLAEKMKAVAQSKPKPETKK